MKFLSLFSGIGGLDLGLERSGFQCVAQVEIEEYCHRILNRHWPLLPKFIDVKGVNRESLGPIAGTIECIAGGFPCGDISIAGNRLGLDGKRSGLYSHFLRLIRELRPRIAIMENVGALLVPIDKGRPAPISRILGDLAEIGYDAEWDLLSTAMFGASHLRERVFVVAYPHVHGVEGRRNRIFAEPVGPGGARCPAFVPGSDSTWQDIAFGPGESFALVSGNHDGVPPELVRRWRDRVGAVGNAVSPIVAEYAGRQILNWVHRWQRHSA